MAMPKVKFWKSVEHGEEFTSLSGFIGAYVGVNVICALCIHVYLHAHTFMRMVINKCACTHMYMHACVHRTHVHVHITHAHTCVYCMCTMCVHTHTHMHVHLKVARNPILCFGPESDGL